MNDGMGEYVADRVVKLMLKKGISVLNSHILLLGFTFKENCPDVRNTKVIDIVHHLEQYNVKVTIFDPWANPDVAQHEYGVTVVNEFPQGEYDAAILAVAHNEFKDIDIPSQLKSNHVIFDVKGFLPREIIDGRL
jgi:UDP-N-acetyl-D-galactosamine dehydrogenase